MNAAWELHDGRIMRVWECKVDYWYSDREPSVKRRHRVSETWIVMAETSDIAWDLASKQQHPGQPDGGGRLLGVEVIQVGSTTLPYKVPNANRRN